mgnify:CR=1 FL=1
MTMAVTTLPTRRIGGFEDVRLVIVGSGEENKYAGLRRTVEITGMRNDVRFFGFVPDRTLAALYDVPAPARMLPRSAVHPPKTRCVAALGDGDADSCWVAMSLR